MKSQSHRAAPLVDHEWRNRAACRDTPVDVFFAFGPPRSEVRELCAGCPVLHDCREWALNEPQQAGFVGGTEQWEREEWRRERRDQ